MIGTACWNLFFQFPCCLPAGILESRESDFCMPTFFDPRRGQCLHERLNWCALFSLQTEFSDEDIIHMFDLRWGISRCSEHSDYCHFLSWTSNFPSHKNWRNLRFDWQQCCHSYQELQGTKPHCILAWWGYFTYNDQILYFVRFAEWDEETPRCTADTPSQHSVSLSLSWLVLFREAIWLSLCMFCCQTASHWQREE